MSWWQRWWSKYGDRAKYDVQKYGVLAALGSLTGIGIWFREWLSGQSWIVLSLLVAVAALSVGCMALSIALVRTRKALKAAGIKKQSEIRSFEDMLERVRREREAAPTELAASATNNENGPGPVSAEIAGRMITADLVLDAVEDSDGITVWLLNNGVRPIQDIKLELVGLTTFHQDKGAFRELKREAVTFMHGRTLQPDEKSEAHRVAFLSHTGRIELSLPEKSYVPNPETRPQIFRATYNISTDQGRRTEQIYFSWKPKEVPTLLQESTIRKMTEQT
ncbi:MAG: hypothetical protein ABI759_03280 [Candidatus Solibacter sp.]